MRKVSTAVTLVGWLVAVTAQAEQPPDYSVRQHSAGSVELHHVRGNPATAGFTVASDSTRLIGRIESYGTLALHAVVRGDAPRGVSGASLFQLPDHRNGIVLTGKYSNRYRRPGADLAASYSMPLSRRSSFFGYMGLPGEPAFGPVAASYTRQFYQTDDLQTAPAQNWLESSSAISEVFTFGYVWRNLKVEGSAFSSSEQNQKQTKTEWRRLDSTSKRLSFNPTPNWAVQISRGHISSLDQLESNQGIRRTTISATYNRAFNELDWQTTLAWGRSSRRLRETQFGYLLESTLKLKQAHAFFGRLEQVGSDDLLRENESLNRQLFKMNKLTLGYVYDIPAGSSVKYDIGGLLCRHLVPSAMTQAYGSDPISYMMFVRVRLK